MIRTFTAVLALIFSVSVSSASADLVIQKNATDVFIRFQVGVSAEKRAMLLKDAHLREVWSSKLVPGLIRAEPTSSTKSLAKSQSSLAARPDVMYVEENYRHYRKLDTLEKSRPTDARYRDQWALVSPNGIQPNGAWNITTGSRDIKVAILDTGIESTHPELSDRVLPGYDFIDRTENVRDSHGHGTHVSGIIGARWDNGGIAGINSETSLIPIRVVPDDADETDANLVEAFEFAVEQGARVANCSFGKDRSGQAVKDVIEAAGQSGLLVVVAAGNSMRDNNRSPSYPANFRTSNMIVVAASNSNGKKPLFSNYGLGQVDLAAPGAQILSSITNGGYDSWDGTSMATPQVVGVAALVMAANPALTVAETKEILLSTVTKKSAWDRYVDTGGLLNATAAVEAAVAAASR